MVQGSFGLPESTSQTASRSVQPFLHVSPMCQQRDRQTYTQTDHATTVATGHILCTAWHWGLIINNARTCSRRYKTQDGTVNKAPSVCWMFISLLNIHERADWENQSRSALLPTALSLRACMNQSSEMQTRYTDVAQSFSGRATAWWQPENKLPSIEVRPTALA